MARVVCETETRTLVLLGQGGDQAGLAGAGRAETM
jgi:hypothetical protein